MCIIPIEMLAKEQIYVAIAFGVMKFNQRLTSEGVMRAQRMQRSILHEL